MTFLNSPSNFDEIRRQLQNVGYNRIDIVLDLVPDAPAESLPDMICLAQAFFLQPQQSELFKALAQRLKNESEATQKKSLIALRSMDVLSDLGSASEFVAHLMPHLPHHLLPFVTETALRADQPSTRLPLLLSLCQRICPLKLEQFVRYLLQQVQAKAAEEQVAWFWGDETLQGLSSYIPAGLHDEAVAAVRTIPYRATQALLLLRFGIAWDDEALISEAFVTWKTRGNDTSDFGDLTTLLRALSPVGYERWRSQIASEILRQSKSDEDFSQWEMREAFWPLLTSKEQQEWLQQRLALARRSPEQETRPLSDDSLSESFSPRAEILQHLPMLPDALVPDVLAIAQSISDPFHRLRLLENFLLSTPTPTPSLIEASFDLIESLLPDRLAIETLVRISYNSSGELQERAVSIALSSLHYLEAVPPFIDPNESELRAGFSDRAHALQDLGPHVPQVHIAEVVRAILDLPLREERCAVASHLLPHIAALQPETVLLLQPLLENVDEFIYSLKRSWTLLTQPVRDSLNPTLWATIVDAVKSLPQADQNPDPVRGESSAVIKGETAIERKNRLQRTICSIFSCLMPEQQQEILQQIFSFERPADLLPDLIEDLPREWQSLVTRRFLQEKSFLDRWGEQSYLIAHYGRYLPPSEQQELVKAQLVDMRAQAEQNLAALYESGHTIDDATSDKGDRRETYSFWRDTFSTLRSFLPLANESQLRGLVSWLRSLPNSTQLTQHDEQYSRGSLWIKEQLLVQSLFILARTIPFGVEAENLLAEALELAFFYPYYPEMGGYGGDAEPENSEVTPESLRESLDQLDPQARRIMIRDLIGVMAEHDASDLVAVSREAVRRVEVAGSENQAAKAAITERLSASPTVISPTMADPAVPTTLHLHLQGRLPAQAQIHNILSVQVRLAPQKSEVSTELQVVQAPAGKALITLILMPASGFDLLSSDRQTVTVERGEVSSWIGFEMRPQRCGRFTLTIGAFQDSVHLGDLTATVAIVERAIPLPEQHWGTTLRPRPTTQGEMTWCIRYEPREQKFHFHFFEPDGGTWESRSKPLVRPLAQMLEQITEQIENAGSEKGSLQRRLLASRGADLWREFLPPDLQDVLYQRSGKLRRVQIVSDGEGLGLPWELLYPVESKSSDSRFLAEQFPLYRWISGAKPALALSWSQPCLVLTEEAPASMVAELQKVRRLLGAFREDVEEPVRSTEQLLERLARADFDWLHIIGHHLFAPTDLPTSGMRLGGDWFRAAYLSTLEGHWRAQRPFVFFNACQTAGAAPLYTGTDSWALRCIRAGASAFAGTMWDVDNAASSHFAEVFYQGLAQRHTIGEAFFTARLQTRDAFQDHCSWLAYVLYGNADATVVPVVSQP